MKKYSELTTKSGKSERIARVLVPQRIRCLVEDKINLYYKTKSEELLDEIREHLLSQREHLSELDRNNIDYWLS